MKDDEDIIYLGAGPGAAILLGAARLEARQFHSDASKDFLVVTTGLAIRFGGDLK